MTDSNRLRLTGVKQTVFGTTQGTPRMRKMRTTGESLKYAPLNVDSDDIRDDRMSADTIKVHTVDSGVFRKPQ